MSMRRDQNLYGRATTAAIAGGAIQVILGAFAGVVGLWAESPAVNALTWHLLGGVPIWIILVLIFHQHKVERIEALAAEQLARKDRAASDLFGDQSDELSRIRVRLDRLYRWGLSVVSIVIAVYLLAVGVGLLIAARPYFQVQVGSTSKPMAVSSDAPDMVLMFLFGAITFLSFVSARWIAGYAKLSEWSLLRGGASYLMGCAVAAALLFGAAIINAATASDEGFRWLAAAIPVLMGLIGIEILLTQLLSAYRPRRKGELPRPAFDSRLLGALTSPESLGKIVADTLNYQFGFEISRSWFYRLLSKAMLPLVGFGLVVLLALSTVVIVEPHQQGMILQSGRMVRQDLGPGLHWKLPWPLQSYRTFPVGRVHQIRFGTAMISDVPEDQASLWSINDAIIDRQTLFLVGPSTGDDTATAGGMELVSADVVVQFRVSDLEAHLTSARSPLGLLRLVAQREAGMFMLHSDIDTLLTTGRMEAGEELRPAIQQAADDLALGIEIVGVALVGVQPPPGRVTRAFRAQMGAKQQAETALQRAEKRAVVTLTDATGSVAHSRALRDAIGVLDAAEAEYADDPEAPELLAARDEVDRLMWESSGQVARTLSEARAYHWRRALTGRSAVSQYGGEIEKFRRAPDYYRAARYLQVLGEGLSNRRKYIVTSETSGVPTFQMDFSESADAIDTLLGE